MSRDGRRRWAVGALSLAAHAAVIAGLLAVPTPPPPAEAPEPLPVALVTLPPPPKPPEPTPEPKPAPKPQAAPRHAPPVRRLPVHPTPAPPASVPPLVVAAGPDTAGEVSDAELAGAAAAGAGSGGGCDMAGRLQSKLRKDARVRDAVALAGGGRALRVWNGDWVRHTGQEGAGLAAVREAIMWEVAFAPDACRSEPVHGPVLISLAEGPGAGRLVLGAGTWRWTDLLRRR